MLKFSFFQRRCLGESDHWLPLSLTQSLTDSCLVDLTDVTLAFEDANSKCLEKMTNLRYGLDVVSVVVLMLNFGRNVEAEFWSKF